MLPAATKLFSLLVETVAEQQEAASPGCNGRQAEDDDDEWEDTSDVGLQSELASLGPGGHHSPDIPLLQQIGSRWQCQQCDNQYL